jgi:hypothetical protein
MAWTRASCGNSRRTPNRWQPLITTHWRPAVVQPNGALFERMTGRWHARGQQKNENDENKKKLETLAVRTIDLGREVLVTLPPELKAPVTGRH